MTCQGWQLVKKEIYKVLTPSQGLARQSNNIVHFLDKAHGLCHSPSQNPLMTPYSILKSTPSATGNQGSTIWQPQTIFTVFSPKTTSFISLLWPSTFIPLFLLFPFSSSSAKAHDSRTRWVWLDPSFPN